jgi:hypothetical protein
MPVGNSPVIDFQTPFLSDLSRLRGPSPAVGTTHLAEVSTRPGTHKITTQVGQPVYSVTFASEGNNTELSLFQALVDAKILTSKVAMVIDNGWRNSFFVKLDKMHDLESWDVDDKPLAKDSVYTFLRAYLTWKPRRNPALGLSVRGNLLAAWRDERARFTVEMLPADKVSYVLVAPNSDLEGNGESFDDKSSGTTKISSMQRILNPYPLASWFEFSEK